MNEGLTGKEIKKFKELLIKSNDLQIINLNHLIVLEFQKRNKNI